MHTRTQVIDIIVPPDGGWGWCVVVAGTLIFMVVDGFSNSMGLYLLPISLDLQQPESKVAILPSIQTAVCFLLGPINSALINAFGMRITMVMGSILSAIGFGSGYFCTSLLQLYIGAGFFAGWGLGMLLVGASIGVPFYFDEYRALATSISFVGSGVGMIGIPMGLELVLANLNWRWMLVTQAGISFLCLFLSLVFIPLKPISLPLVTDTTNMQASHYRQSFRVADFTDHDPGTLTLHQARRESSYRFVDKSCWQNVKSFFHFGCFRWCVSDENLPPNRPLYRDDVFYTHSLTRLPQYEETGILEYHMSVTHLNIPKKGMKAWFPEAVTNALGNMLSLKMLISIGFISICLTNILYSMGVFLPTIYTPTKLGRLGVPPEIAWKTVPVLGASYILGRVVTGIVTTKSKLSPLLFAAINFGLSAVIVIIGGFFDDVLVNFVYMAGFGTFISGYPILRTLIMVDHFGIEKLSNAVGYTYMSFGVGTFIGIPLASMIEKWTGSFIMINIYGGVCFILSMILTLVLKPCLEWDKKIGKANI